MAANALMKQISVLWTDMLVNFDDQLVLSKAVEKFETDQTLSQRSSDVTWRPLPNIALSGNGLDQTSAFSAASATSLAVPASLGFQKASVFNLTALELRDALNRKNLFTAAKQKLAADINVAVNNVAANQGAIVIKRTTAATGYDDMSLCDAAMSERGVVPYDRFAGISPRDYNAMAGNLAARQTMAGLPTNAYERALIDGNVAGFEMLKMDYASRLTLAAGVTVSVTGANQFYVPAATTTQSDGSITPKDNRYQTLPITVTSGTVKVGDAFTIVGVNSVHNITKVDTGQLMTFRIQSIVTGAGGTGTVQISPPIISGQGASQAELQYQNVTATPASGAVIVFLNTTTAPVNCFWQKGAIELYPGRYEVPTASGAEVMYGTTPSGVSLVATAQLDINTLNLKMRVDTLFGVTCLQPTQCGIMLFGQS